LIKHLKHIRLFGGLRPLRHERVLRDTLAGFTLASINIPQVLGYSRIAQMPVVTGLYTLLLPTTVFAIFGSSRHLVVAADSATAAIFAGSLSPLAATGSLHYTNLVGMTALLTAGLLLLARAFSLGFLADFLSRTVLTGFLAGVGCQVAIAMLGDMLGVETTSRNSLLRLWQVLEALPRANAATVLLSSAVAALILLGNRFARQVPVPLAAVVVTITVSHFYGLAGQGIALIGPVPGGLPPLRLPSVTWSEFLMLLPVSASCFVMIIAQSAATARVFAVRYREDEDINADILGLSAANAAAALSGTFVVNGSPTQTAMGNRVGARSQIAQLALAGAVVLVLLLLSGQLAYLPRCVLAAIVFTIALGMIDIRSLRDIRRESPGEYYLSFATVATVVILGVEQGILLAIAVSLFRHVRHSYHPHTMMFVPDTTGRWVPEPATPGKVTEPGLIVYRFGADLFYANQHRFCGEVRELVKQAPMPVRWFIIDSAAITDIDYSAACSLRDLLEDLQRDEVQVVFGRVSSYLKSDMDRHGITAVVGEMQICPTLHEATAMAGLKSPLAP
jgi:MFS superfamily sulfate permease-like transporter